MRAKQHYLTLSPLKWFISSDTPLIAIKVHYIWPIFRITETQAYVVRMSLLSSVSLAVVTAMCTTDVTLKNTIFPQTVFMGFKGFKKQVVCEAVDD
jgi:hypothetical protein